MTALNQAKRAMLNGDTVIVETLEAPGVITRFSFRAIQIRREGSNYYAKCLSPNDDSAVWWPIAAILSIGGMEIA